MGRRKPHAQDIKSADEMEKNQHRKRGAQAGKPGPGAGHLAHGETPPEAWHSSQIFACLDAGIFFCGHAQLLPAQKRATKDFKVQARLHSSPLFYSLLSPLVVSVFLHHRSCIKASQRWQGPTRACMSARQETRHGVPLTSLPLSLSLALSPLLSLPLSLPLSPSPPLPLQP